MPIDGFNHMGEFGGVRCIWCELNGSNLTDEQRKAHHLTHKKDEQEARDRMDREKRLAEGEAA